jgi:hypothetical protein
MMHPNEENREDKISIFLASIPLHIISTYSVTSKSLHPQKVATEIVLPEDVKSVESFSKSDSMRQLMINLRTFC